MTTLVTECWILLTPQSLKTFVKPILLWFSFCFSAQGTAVTGHQNPFSWVSDTAGECNMRLAHLFKEHYLSSVRMLASLSLSSLFEWPLYKDMSTNYFHQNEEVYVTRNWLSFSCDSEPSEQHCTILLMKTFLAILFVQFYRWEEVPQSLRPNVSITVLWNYYLVTLFFPHENIYWCCWWGY